MKKFVGAFGLAALVLLAPTAEAIPLETVGGVDTLVAWGNVGNSDAAESDFMADYLGVDASSIEYTKIDVGGGEWIAVDGSSSLWAFDFSPYVIDPLVFLVKLGNATYTHYLYENDGSLQYGVIDLSGFDARRGKITILSVSHAATAGGTIPTPEPASLTLMLLGVVGAGITYRKRRHNLS